MNIRDLTNKVANNGANVNGKLTAEEYNVLITQVKNMSNGAVYMGVATPTTTPQTFDGNVELVYLATTAGKYTAFGNIVVNNDEICALRWRYSVGWGKEVIATNDYTTEEKEQLAKNTSDIAANTAKITEQDATLAKHGKDIAKNVEDIAKKANTTEYYPAMAVGVADNLRGRGEATEEEFTYRPSAGASDSISEEGVATMKRIKGNSVVWTQLAQSNEKMAEFRKAFLSYDEDDKIFTLMQERNVNNIALNMPCSGNKKSIAGHIYLLIHSGTNSLGNLAYYGIGGLYEKINTYASFITAKEAAYFYLFPFGASNTIAQSGSTFTIDELKCVDLTASFGAGNEPSTIEEFYARIPEGIDMNAYNEGQLISMNANAIETIGFNQFNGTYAKVIGGQTYYLGGTYTSVGFTAKLGGTIEAITIPSDSLYSPTKSGYIYASGEHICINLSHSGVRNGEYEPYKKSIKDLSVIQKYFPNGMKSAGSVYDEITDTEAIQRIGEVDLGSLNWGYNAGSNVYSAPCNGIKRVVTYPYGKNVNAINNGGYTNSLYGSSQTDADKLIFVNYKSEKIDTINIRDTAYSNSADFKTAMQGVKLYYELADPIITPIVTRDINLNYLVWDWGTERAVSDVPSAPFRADIIYGFNAVDRIRDNSRDIETLNSEITNKVSAIRVNDRTITRKDSTGLLDIGDVSNLYVADFTIEDLDRLYNDGALLSLEVNANALLQALQDGKAIGIREDNNISGGTPSMLIASAYKDDFLYLSVISSQAILYQVHIDCLAAMDPSIEDAKSGIIYKGEMLVSPIETLLYILDFSAEGIKTAYESRETLRCDYNTLLHAIENRYDIRIMFNRGVIPVNAHLETANNYESITLSYIISDTWWSIKIYREEDESGNVYGEVAYDETFKTNLAAANAGSRYIIQDFTIENIIDNDVVTITSELVKAITDNRPLAIYYATSESLICDITEVSADLATRTRISLKVSYGGGGNLIIDSPNVVTEGGRIRASSYWAADPNTHSITNSSGGIIHPDDGVITVPPSFFADKSVESCGDNPQSILITINKQVTILERPLMANGEFKFSPPPINTAVEYIVRFRVNTQCSWMISNMDGVPLDGTFHGISLIDISSGFYVMKITLCTYVNSKGNTQTEYIAEVMPMVK